MGQIFDGDGDYVQVNDDGALLVSLNDGGSAAVSGAVSIVGTVPISTGGAFPVSGSVSVLGTVPISTGGALQVSGNVVATVANDPISAVISAPLDKYGAIQSIPFEHHEIHDGDHFFIEGWTTLSNGASGNFVVSSPAELSAHLVHMTFEVQAQSEIEVKVYKNPVVLVNGTVLTPVNNNQDIDTPSCMVSGYCDGGYITMNPTIVSKGTLLSKWRSGKAGATPTAGDVGTTIQRAEKELVLKRGTKYLWSVVSYDNTNVVSYRGTWYEHGA